MRHAPRRFAPILAGLLLLPISGCHTAHEDGAPAADGANTAESTSEADRTRMMEEKQAEIERMAEDIRTMEGTEQEKIDAVNRLEEARRELNAMAEGGNP